MATVARSGLGQFVPKRESVPTPEYAAEKGRGRNGIRGERQKTGVNFKGTENSEKSVVFMCLTLSNSDTPESEAGTLSGADIHPFMKIHAEQRSRNPSHMDRASQAAEKIESYHSKSIVHR